eukprot:TRINITY_DN6704_c0_g1_i4.p1 TRINITY_DN6704_c0_g1~~TRINITY_DN6704_c0_g1_i4.p1  ORF type:complete len:233 (+),score=43.05 TRINITY_DN6704_c0_g1_i4:174-872(+)
MIDVISEHGQQISARAVVTACGLHADSISQKSGGQRDPDIIPVRGEFLMLNEESAGMVRGLIYPVPDPSLPWLGVHFTRLVDGGVKLGPNALLGGKKEAYNFFDFDRKEFTRMLSNRNLQKLLVTHTREGIKQLLHSVFPALYVKALQRYMPGLRLHHVRRGPAGVRALAMNNSATQPGKSVFVDDFVFEQHSHWPILHVRNAPSPAATASLAIGGHIAERLFSSGLVDTLH